MRAVNLLPTGERARHTAPAPGGAGHILLGVLGALLVAVLAVVFTQNQITDRRTEIARAKLEQQQAEQRATKLGGFAQFAQIKQTRVQSVSDLAKSRFDWERFMRELALVLPSGTWITEANAASSGLPEGAAASGAPSSTPPASAPGTDPASAGPSVNLVGCARTQRTVAATMVRLRRLYRAEEVKLADSSTAAEAASSAGTGATTDSGSSSDGCGKRYKFDIAVSFSAAPPDAPQGERGDDVPVRLGGGA